MSHRPTAPCSSGEAVSQVLFIEGPIYYKVQGTDNTYIKLTVVEDSQNPGIYVFQADQPVDPLP